MNATCTIRLRTIGLFATVAALAAPAVLAQAPASTQPAGPPERVEPLPLALREIGIDEKLNAALPLEAAFVNQDGKAVKLKDYFDGKRPVVLTLNYYRCPMLCGLTLNGLADGMKQLEWTAGNQFRVVTVSFDSHEPHALAHAKRRNYLDYLDRPEAAGDWSFLVGNQASINQLLSATGFKVKWDPQREEWAHAAALILCTPDGRISRYLYGIEYDPKTMRLSLVEASEGKVGSTLDKILLFCFHYDGDGKYALHAMNLMRASGVIVMAGLGSFLVYYWRREGRRPAVPAAPAS